MTAEQAIDRSVSHDEIVFIEYSSAAREQLKAACEGSVTAFGHHEYWGTRDDGEEWRVHVAEERAEEEEL